LIFLNPEYGITSNHGRLAYLVVVKQKGSCSQRLYLLP
jgi:hypothetical protein